MRGSEQPKLQIELLLKNARKSRCTTILPAGGGKISSASSSANVGVVARTPPQYFQWGYEIAFFRTGSRRQWPPMSDLTQEIPRPPSYLNKAARREWRRIVPKLHEEYGVSHLDKANLGAYCQIVARIAEAAIAIEGTVITTPSGIRRANPWCAILNTSLRQLARISDVLGLSQR
jgi:P27 family predicted phage terminase small subunit